MSLTPKTAIPPPPPPPIFNAPIQHPKPVVSPTGPDGSFMVELLIYTGSPFKDHWAYWVHSHDKPDIGVLMHANGDVMKGFEFEIRRGHDLRVDGNFPTKKVPLQWVDGEYFYGMLSNREERVDHVPACAFEDSAYKVKVPEKSLNAVDERVMPSTRKKITQRDCQTWIVESAHQLAKDGIFKMEVAAYLHAIEQ